MGGGGLPAEGCCIGRTGGVGGRGSSYLAGTRAAIGAAIGTASDAGIVVVLSLVLDRLGLLVAQDRSHEQGSRLHHVRAVPALHPH
jgi:ABC-type proline/glycine betaine transport system permease subunit